METRVRVAALTISEGCVLLVSAKRSPDYLVPPGGGLEAGETLSEAVEREVREEAGVAVQGGELVAYGQTIREGRTELELYFAAHLRDPQSLAAQVSEENRSVQWVALSALPATLHFPAELRELCGRVGRPGPLYLGCRTVSQ